MTEVDFYLLSGDDRNAFEHFVVRLAEKSLHSGRKMLMLTASEDASLHLSHQLWHLRPESFLPHHVPSEPSNHLGKAAAPNSLYLWVNHQCSDCPHTDVLLNLADELPEKHFSRFTRLIELVQESESDLARARQHYQFLKARGYPIRTHDLRGKH